MIGVITGSGLYDLGKAEQEEIATEFGSVTLNKLEINGKHIAHIARHGDKHELLPNNINYRAHIAALQKCGCTLIVSTTVCGITNPAIKLAQLLLFDDLFFPDNRLPNGELCTFFTKPADKKRGHYIFGSPFCSAVLEKLDGVKQVTYAHVNGPRFNSKKEIKFISSYADAVSQTCGPEAVLAGELEIPYVLLGFGVDYANGVKETPTAIEELNANMEKSKVVFREAIEHITQLEAAFEGFVYRFA